MEVITMVQMHTKSCFCTCMCESLFRSNISSITRRNCFTADEFMVYFLSVLMYP